MHKPGMSHWGWAHLFQQSKESIAGSFAKYMLSLHSPGASQISLEIEKINVENKMA